MADTATQERLGRLLGGGSDNGRGGVPVASLFRPILEYVLDHGPSTLGQLAKAVEGDHFMAAKEELLANIYGPIPWRAATTDSVEQLRSVKLLDCIDGHWVTGESFEAGAERTIIRKDQRRDGQEGIKLTTYPKAQRDMANEEFEQRATFKEVVAAHLALDPQRPGLRPVDPARVAGLVASIRGLGYLKDSKIYRDKNTGRILDGRHRLAAAKQAGVVLSEATHYRDIEVGSDQEALEWAWLLNKGAGTWTKGDITHVTRLLGGRNPDELLPGPRVRLEMAKQAVRENPELPVRVIESLTGIPKSTVSRAQRELKAAGEDVRSPSEAKREKVMEAKAANPEASNREIGRLAGVDDHTVARVLSAESVPTLGQTPHSEPEPQPVPVHESQPESPAPKASPIRQNWTIGWKGDYGEAPEKIVRKLMREPDIARQVLKLLRDELE